jgi:phage tail-like protein
MDLLSGILDQGYLSGFRYFVSINNILFGFSRVANLSMQIQPEIYTEGGGGNSHVMDSQEKSEKTKRQVLHLEKGICNKVDLASWLLTVGCHVENIIIIVKKSITEVGKLFYIDEGVITKVSYSDLDAENGGMLMLSLDITHEGLQEGNI